MTNKSINHLNTLLQNERIKFTNLFQENFSLRMDTRELERRIEKLIIDNKRIHTKTIEENSSPLKKSEQAKSKEAQKNNTMIKTM